MQTKEIREKTIAELKAYKAELAKERCRLGLSMSSDEKVKSHKFTVLRKAIARVNTILTEKKESDNA
ncbi:MAG: 50S ribosomal protein L29 [Legionellales bacterium]|nr:50S ribosomal protein L29 [Legionellales bacterium]|tara:strand:- start:2751 stop:2951 length:201 start_codon:yes stop_codon:yes gene_type:complete